MGNVTMAAALISGGCHHRGRGVYTSCCSPDCALHIPTSRPPIVMLPRRNSTNVTSAPALPPRTIGSFGDKRPLSLVTNQQPFRADTTETQETESPQSETSPQPTPPIPPRPAAFPPLPSGVGGLRRKTTRLNTYDTYTSALEEHVPPPSQSPNFIMSMPSTPSQQVPGRPPPTPVRPRQHAPGGGVGGFAGGSPSQQGPSHDNPNPHHNTADYTYRFDTLPSFRSDSGPPQYESANVTGGVHAKVWPTYNKISQEFDEKLLEKWNSDLDVLLIFVSLVVGGDHQFPSD